MGRPKSKTATKTAEVVVVEQEVVEAPASPLSIRPEKANKYWKRATLEVTTIRELANSLMADEATDSASLAGIRQLAETILRETENFKGFTFIGMEAQADGSVKIADPNKVQFL